MSTTQPAKITEIAPDQLPIVELDGSSGHRVLRWSAAELIVRELEPFPVTQRGLATKFAQMGGDRRTIAAVDVSGGRVVAAGSLQTGRQELGPAEGMIWDVIVTESARKRGLGGKILGRLEAMAQQSGLTQLRLWEAETARNFYSRFGWEPQPDQVNENGAILQIKRLGGGVAAHAMVDPVREA